MLRSWEESHAILARCMWSQTHQRRLGRWRCAVRGERPGAARLHPHAEGTRRAPGRGTAARARRPGGHAPAERDRSGGSAMTRADAAKIALLAYPSPTRTARGDEMPATLLDASAGSRRRFSGELVDLTRVGLRERATLTARAGAGRLAADGLCL